MGCADPPRSIEQPARKSPSRHPARGPTRWRPMMHRSSSSLARALLALGVLLLGSAQPLLAQNTGIIRGRVTEAGTGRPVPDARVTITGRQQGAVTSASGDYVIPSVATGTAELLARRIGYGRSTRTVTVTAGAETRADFTISITAS